MRFPLPLAAILMALLAGCTTAVNDPLLAQYALSDAGPASAGARLIAAENAALGLPALASDVVEVRRTALAENGRRETTVYRSRSAIAGENTLRVEITRGGVLRKAPSEAEIRGEMQAALPGVPMTIDAAPRENRFGLFGQATGRMGNTACVYAWQTAALHASDPGFSDGGSRLTIRFRYCDDAAQQATVERLMESLTGLLGRNSV